MAGADAGGVVVFDENGHDFRDTTTLGLGYRAVDPNVMCPSALVRTPQVGTDPTLKRGRLPGSDAQWTRLATALN